MTMNKQEVIEKIKNISAIETFLSEIIWVKRDEVLDIVKQLDEPKKPVIPRIVADWIEDNREALEEYVYSDVQIVLPRIQDDNPMYSWLDGKGIDIIVDCVRNGYEVEKEKVYRARHKLTGEYLSQNYAKTGYYHGLDRFHILKLSKKDWEELGVLDDKMYEVEEVKK